jgi:hypothetical protein
VTIEERPIPAPPLLDLPAPGVPTVQSFSLDPATGAIGFFRVSTGQGNFLWPLVVNLAATPPGQGGPAEATRQPDVDTVLTVWDPALSRVVAENDDAVPADFGIAGNTNSNLVATLRSSASKDFWILVDHFALQDQDQNGLETLTTLTLETPVPVSYPDGGQPFIDASRSLSASRPVQWYWVSVLPGKLLTALLDGSSGGLNDVAIGVVDVGGAVLGFDAPIEPVAGVQKAVLQSSQTLVVVSAFDDLVKPVGGVTGAFSVSVGQPAACDPIPGASAPTGGQLAVNEILADPAFGVPAGDANGDGLQDNGLDDQFVELVSTATEVLDLGGVALLDLRGNPTGVRHVFPCGTTLAPGHPLVVFGGGRPSGLFGRAQVKVANVDLACLASDAGPPRSLCLDPSGDGLLVQSASGAEVTRAQLPTLQGGASFVRCEDAGGSSCDSGAVYLRHDTIPGVTALFSPGTRVNGAGFFAVGGETCQNAPLVDATSPGRTLHDQSTSGYANDYRVPPGAGGCPSLYGTPGPDAVYAVAVPSGATLNVTVTPGNTFFDPAVYLLGPGEGSCVLEPSTCLAGIDEKAEGEKEALSYRNSTESLQLVFIVVDSFYTDQRGSGPYALSLSLSP